MLGDGPPYDVAMTIDLADHVDGTPGRFVPQEMKGELVEAEHLTRYWWSAGLAKGRRVLDAGCGMAYGSVLLADAGAAEVTGVDLAEDVIHAAQAEVGDRVRLRAADVHSLPFDDGAFDLVVCFEVIEHVDEQDEVLDELRRVLAPGGVLAISSPNRDAYVPGNPHHRHEYTTAELDAALSARWPEVRLHQQHTYAATSITGSRPEVRTLSPKPLGEETYTLALASDRALAEVAGLVTLAAPVDIRAWVERFADQQEILQRQADLLGTAQRDADRRREAQKALAEAESALAELPALRERARLAEAAHGALADRVGQAEERAERAERVTAGLQASLSWRVTAPLRAAKRLRSRGR